MRTLALLLTLLVVPPPAPADWRTAPPGDWQELFNGRNLDGWVVKLAHHELGDNYRDTFRVEHGLIRVMYDKYDEFGARFGHLLYEKPMIGSGVANGYDSAIKKDGTSSRTGYVALQAESQPVEFRNVRLLNLSGCVDPASPAYRAYVVHRDETTCTKR
jgi:hypothetical protein